MEGTPGRTATLPATSTWAHARWTTLALVAGLSGVYLLPFARVLWRVGDEGTIVNGAIRVTQGDIPYRDFFEVMGPGSFYWLAAWFHTFGASWFALRSQLLLTWVAIAVTMYYLARRAHDGWVAPFACAFYTLVALPLWPASSHHWDSTLFGLLMVAAFGQWQTTGRIVWLIPAGVLGAAATCTILAKGVALFGVALALVVLSGSRPSAAARSALALIGSYACVLAAVALWFYRHQALDDLLATTIAWPATHYSTLNRVPYGFSTLSAAVGIVGRVMPPGPAFSPLVAVCLIPLAFVVALPALAAAVQVRIGFHHWRQALQRRDATTTYLLLGLALWVSELQRPDLYHLLWGTPLLLIGVSAAAATFLTRRIQTTTVAALSAAVVVSAAFSVTRALNANEEIVTRRGTVLTERSDPALAFIVDGVAAGSPFFVYPYYPMYYYLADLSSATRYSILIDNYNTPAQFADAISDLERHRVEFVLWDTVVAGDNLRRWFPGYRSSRDNRVEAYLATHYDDVAVANGFRIMRRIR
jgi:membrane protein implicated in regulation of membrane protease activity